MIVSQTCDIQTDKKRGDIVLVTPILEMEEYEKELIKTKEPSQVSNILQSIRNQETGYYFYLKPSGTFKESYVNLTVIAPLNRTLVKIDKRILCLSPYSRHHLQYLLSCFFGRPFDQNKP
jgi:hypothetical protein